MEYRIIQVFLLKDRAIISRVIKTFLFVLCLLTSAIEVIADIQQEQVKGKVVMFSNEQPVADVEVLVDSNKEVISDSKGNFTYAAKNASSRPDNVTAYLEGYELAFWEFENKQLTLYMREATMRDLEGTLNAKGEPVANQTIILHGDIDYEATSDNNGHFALKIRYSNIIDKSSRFTYMGNPLKIIELAENPQKATVEVKLEIPDEQPKSKLTTVKVIDRKQVPFERTIVTISGVSYITAADGTFTVNDVSTNEEDWYIEGIEPISIKPAPSSNIITVILPRRDNRDLSSGVQASGSKVLIDTIQITTQVDNIKTEIDELIKFYNVQSNEIEKRNEKLSFLIDSLSNLTQLNVTDREGYLNQVEQLSNNVGKASVDFYQLKTNSITLINALRNLLVKQEQKIRAIEIEKERQAKKFRNDLLFVLSILGMASLLLVVVIFVAKRISARKKVVERIKDQLADAQDIAKIGSMTYFLSSKQHEYSEHFFKILGIKNENRIKKLQRKTDQYVHEELVEKDELETVNNEFKKSLETKKPLSMELKVRADDDHELFVDLRAKIEQNSSGKPVAISSTLQDVTEKKARELQLIEAKTVAEKANQEKEDFLSTMSHEIRTPLNGIVGLTDHLISSRPPKHLEENLKTLKFSADHLLSLVNDVLDYNKIKAGKMVLANTTFDLKEHINNTIKAMTLIALHKGVSLESKIHDGIPEMVKGDKVRLNQVIANLLNNALKFTEKGKVEVILKIDREIDNKVYVHFNVKDTGIGIENSMLDKIFENFEQENIVNSNKYGGTGLGLAISRQLVKLFGGELLVKSKLGEGSEFYFTIPFDKITEKDVKQHQSHNSHLNINDFSKLSILCVEDNEVNQLVISQYFENWKINYSFAATGEEALEKFRKETYNIVFMDINLPDQRGDEVVMKMKNEFPDSDCAFIALTAESSESLQEVMIKSGISGYLNKPFSSEDLKLIIGKFGINKISV
jgi:signal transduction histidine kinase/CheY-like chemotaxis protein